MLFYNIDFFNGQGEKEGISELFWGLLQETLLALSDTPLGIKNHPRQDH